MKNTSEKFTVELEEPLSGKLYDELYRRVFYVSPSIKSFEIVVEGENITGVFLETDDSETEENLTQKVKKMIEKDVAGRKVLKDKIVWSNHPEVPNGNKIFDVLKEKNLVYEMGDGQIAFHEDICTLMNFFDREIKKIVKKLFHATEYIYPTLMQAGNVKRCENLKTFPQYVMGVTTLKNDVDSYENFKANTDFTSEADMSESFLRNSGEIRQYLPTTMCYYTYQQNKDRVLKDDEAFTVTTKGKSFRYESAYCKDIERLWDFTIREIVFYGDNDYVLDCRKRMMDAAFELMKTVGMDVFCETASDPFFFDESANDRQIFQKYMKSKYELRAFLDGKDSISIASFNYHDTFFSNNFNIKFENGELIKTACTGFGLERLTYAFLCQFGIDREKWPDIVKERMEIYENL